MKTNDPLTAINLMNMGLTKMSPHTRNAIPKSTINAIKNLIAASYGYVVKYPFPDFVKIKYMSLNTLVENVLNSYNFVELDASGKEIIVKAFEELIYHMSLFACKYYLAETGNEFDFYPGLENLLISIVQVGVANNIQF